MPTLKILFAFPFSLYPALLPSGRLHSEYVERLSVEPYAAEPFPAPPQTLYRVYAQGPEYLLQFVLPRVNEINEPFGENLRVEPRRQLWPLGGDAPRAVSGITLSANSASHCDERGSGYRDRVRSEGYGLCRVTPRPYPARR